MCLGYVTEIGRLHEDELHDLGRPCYRYEDYIPKMLQFLGPGLHNFE